MMMIPGTTTNFLLLFKIVLETEYIYRAHIDLGLGPTERGRGPIQEHPVNLLRGLITS